MAITIRIGTTDYPLEDAEARTLVDWLRKLDRPGPLKLDPDPREINAAAVIIEHALATREDERAALELTDLELRAVANVTAALADEAMARLVHLDTWTSPRVRALDAALRDHLGFPPPPVS